MTPSYPGLCTAKLPLGAVTELDCFLPHDHDGRMHWDAVDAVWWMSEEEHDAPSPQ